MMDMDTKSLDKDLSFESMLGDLSARLVNRSLESIDETIESSMKLLVEFWDDQSKMDPVIKIDLPFTKIKLPVVKIEFSVTKMNLPVIKMNLPVIKIEFPVIKMKLPVNKIKLTVI
jgi:hypothetical protein